jgi:hypothetical protein
MTMENLQIDGVVISTIYWVVTTMTTTGYGDIVPVKWHVCTCILSKDIQ